MQTRNDKIFIGIGALLLIICLFVLCSREAKAGEGNVSQHTMLNNAAAICYPALPVYDGNVRKRPLAVVNEGTIGSFVTCAFTVREEAYVPAGGVERFGLMLKNQGSTPQTIHCTAVNGVDNGQAKYLPLVDTLQPGERAWMEWGPGPWIGPVGVSCLLPVLTGINETRVHWDANENNATGFNRADPNIINK